MEVADLDVVRPLRLSRAQLVSLDCLVSVILTAVLLTFALAKQHPVSSVPGWAVCLVEATVGLPIGMRRLWPIPVFAVAVAASLIAAILGLEDGYFASVASALYLVALTWPGPVRLPTAWVGLLGAVAILAAGVAGPGSDAGTAVVVGVAVTAAAWTAGRAVRERRAYAAASASQLADRAAADERLRIARELHDIVAHSMSLIAVKAGVAKHVAPVRPAEALEALDVIETTSKGALGDMRRLLGVLRTDTDPELTPAATSTDLDELAQRAGTAGIEVDLDIQGADGLPAGVALSVYRIVQEALTNAVKYAAPATCHVVVEADGTEVRIEVVDDGPGQRQLPGPPGLGYGLTGMRERAAMYGGAFTAGPRPEGGFVVSARLPYGPGRETNGELA